MARPDYVDENGDPIDPTDPNAQPTGPTPPVFTPGPGTTPAPPGGPFDKPVPAGQSGGSGTPTPPAFNLAKLKAALLAYNVPASPDALKAFITAHPDFAQGVTIGGSKNNKLYDPSGKFLADVIQGTSGSNPTWAWDESVGGSSAGSPSVDPSYLNPFTQTFPDFYQKLYGKPYESDPSAPAFQAPNAQDIYQDPSYQFRFDQGEHALENSAAARGVLNSGGTLSDLINYGQGAASQEYGNVFDRKYNLWNQDWQHTQEQHSTDVKNAWDQYLTTRDTFYKNQDNPFAKLMGAAGVGLQGASA